MSKRQSDDGEPDVATPGPVDTRLTRRDLGSWLSGPGVAAPLLDADGNPWKYRGERLGLPETGPGSLATVGRRLAALAIDWGAALLLVRLFLPQVPYGSPESSLLTLAFFAMEVAVFTWVAGSSFGQRVLGLQVVRLGGRGPGLARSLGRTALLCLVVPPLIWDRDGRGLHDRLIGTVLMRRS